VLDFSDDIQQGAVITHDGEVKNARTREALEKAALEKAASEKAKDKNP
jgi:hypothetical protein